MRHYLAHCGTNTAAVKMTGDELKSAEKRASDAALEKENMRVAMTAQEQKAISTTYVFPDTTQYRHPGHNSMHASDLMLHPLLYNAGVEHEVFFAFGKSLRPSQSRSSYHAQY